MRLIVAVKAQEIVIDDLDTAGDTRPIESNLLSLLFTIRAPNGRIILTSSANLPQRLLLALSITSDQPYSLRRFTDADIHDFLLSLGCPPDLATSWTTIVALTTSGHPQLVNARVQALGRAGFPQPTETELATPPLDLAETRLEARRLIAAELTPPERELLYRLSLCMDDFPRDQVLSIANLPQPIDFPGEAFDGLVGPWIEVTGPGRFAVSPLVKGCGSEIHDTDWMRRTRSGIASSMLGRSTLSPFEVSEIFTQGFLAADSLVLGQIIVGLMRSEIKDPNVARFLSWIAHIGIDQNSTDLPVDEPTRLLFRILQYRIASLTDPALALRINHVTEAASTIISDPLSRTRF